MEKKSDLISVEVDTVSVTLIVVFVDQGRGLLKMEIFLQIGFSLTPSG